MGEVLNAYRVLCGAVGTLLIAAGLALFASFFAYHMPDSHPRLPTGPTGHYFAAFAGCASLGWGGALWASARQPLGARGVGTATAVALVFSAFYRMMAWITGDYYAWPGELLRVEAALFLLLALAFVWLRPPSAATTSA
jgi:hypothetical protein